MKDVFYTLLVVWIISRIFNSLSSAETKSSSNNKESNSKQNTKPSETIHSTPPKKKNFGDDEGEYVDFEEVK